MIIRNRTSGSNRVLTFAENRPQRTDHGPQPIELNLQPYFLWLLVKKRIILLKNFSSPALFLSVASTSAGIARGASNGGEGVRLVAKFKHP